MEPYFAVQNTDLGNSTGLSTDLVSFDLSVPSFSGSGNVPTTVAEANPSQEDASQGQSPRNSQTLSYSQIITKNNSKEAQQKPLLALLLTKGSREDRLADLEAQDLAFYNKRNQSKYFNIVFSEIRNISEDVDIVKLETEIDQKIGKLKKITKHSRNSLLVESNNSTQSENILKLQSLAGHKVKTSPDPILSFAKGVVRSKAMVRMTDEELKKRLSSQGVTHIDRMKTRTNGIEKDSGTFILSFKGSSPPALVRLNEWHCEIVDPYTPFPMRCKRCQKLGHTKNQCRSEAESCERCGVLGHAADTCTSNKPTCINCSEDHQAASNNCPHYLMRKEILKVQSQERISFREAKAKVRVSYAAIGRRYNFESKDKPNNPPIVQPSMDDASGTITEAPEDTDVLNVNTDESNNSPSHTTNINTDENNNAPSRISSVNMNENISAPARTSNVKLDVHPIVDGSGSSSSGGGERRRPRSGGKEPRRGRPPKLDSLGEARDQPKGKRSESLSGTPSGLAALSTYSDMDEEITRVKRSRQPSSDLRQSKKPQSKTSKIDVLSLKGKNKNKPDLHPADY